MNELVKVAYDNDMPTVLGRDLHAALEVQTAYKDWFPRMCEYGFQEGVDFNPLKFERVQMEGERAVNREVSDHQLTIAMAKELCMLQRTEQGKACRRYFISIEEAWNKPEVVMARALQISDRKVKELEASAEAMRPKAEYYDALVERDSLTNFRETAKLIGIGEHAFIGELIKGGYIYRDKRGCLLPYAGKHSDLFRVRECCSAVTGLTGTQTLVTVKGRHAFVSMFGNKTA